MSVVFALGAESKTDKKTDGSTHRRSYLWSLSVNGATLSYDSIMEDDMAYETQHILDFVMEDDARREGTDVSVEVDTNETVKISFGNSFTLRTSYNSLNDLIMALERASDELDNIIYDNTQRSLGNVVEGAMSEQQRVDPYDNKEYNTNDPRNW